MAPQIRIGCSGWQYKSWHKEFYPEGLGQQKWLSYYAEHFDTVEVNASFYRLPTQKSVARWIEQTPEDFVFAIKGSRFLTHMKKLTDHGQGLDRFYERIEPIVGHPKMGPLLWQLPENFRCDVERLRRFADALRPGRHAWEFRHPSWFVEEVYDVLRERGMALVYGDRPGRDFQTDERTADFMFVRFHYGHRGRRGNYSESELREWSERILDWGREGDVYVYFNNDWEVFAVRNAQLMQRLVAREREGAMA